MAFEKASFDFFNLRHELNWKPLSKLLDPLIAVSFFTLMLWLVSHSYMVQATPWTNCAYPSNPLQKNKAAMTPHFQSLMIHRIHGIANGKQNKKHLCKLIQWSFQYCSKRISSLHCPYRIIPYSFKFATVTSLYFI